MRFTFVLLALVFSIHTSFSQNKKTNDSQSYRERIDLSGEWQFALDTANAGVKQKWFSKNLPESIKLPQTTDEAKKGFLNKDTTTMHLNRVYCYEGASWYRKKVTIPKSFGSRYVELLLERTKSSMIWVDDQLVGNSTLLQTAQRFDVSKYLTPGEHFITIRIDNSLKLTPYGNVHIYSDDTQTNWNGIIGKIYLEASSKTHITNLQVFPDIENKSFAIKLEIDNPSGLKNATVDLLVEKQKDGKVQHLKTVKQTKKLDKTIELSYDVSQNFDLWDEYQQPIYKLTAIVSTGKSKDAQSVSFGMRKFAVKGTQFAINDRTTFLRGKHEACVFPLTGHPPMDVEGWLSVLKIAKSYGINHYRFHSYCPPEAAFTAADQVGIYLQPELPFWGELNTDSVANMLLQEGKAMLKSYANHPSFVMFSHGNELGGNLDKVQKNIETLKAYDGRPLYTEGSNIYIGYHEPAAMSDFYLGARTPSSGDTALTHIRLTHAFVDSRDGGILNTQLPSTKVNFDYAVSKIKIPIVSHEIGQYQIYPDFNEIKKYTGVLEARNLMVFRDRLKNAGMLDQDIVFQKASGAWSALCYKAEMEAAIRTKGMGGFQLLDLQDFPGQGTALVGILDAFMDSKNVISKQDWLSSCNDAVLLLEFPKYCYTNKETFNADIVVANYSNKLVNGLCWEVKNSSGVVLKEGALNDLKIDVGGLTNAANVSFQLSEITKAEKLTINLSANDGLYINSYPIWVYPELKTTPVSENVTVVNSLTNETITKLKAGGKVLLFPQTADVKKNSIAGLFPPEFWNWGMFKGISEWAKKPVSPGTLGILTDPQHPIFNSFPTDSHTNWQWFSIIKASNALILDDLSNNYSPIVQVIDNLERNHKLGLVFEFKVGDGKLLVCMSQLLEIKQHPEALQFYQSLINYMNSTDFNPKYQIEPIELSKLLRI
ncbi:beta-galactosidase [Solitalea sp. MAHUQ-68]|uniref:Beta-galactosidase n=1 Tax=Solitalea agri TaxID=2953739 RepID=A0A9X2F3S7_9SPHI|nr:sugar-binding domain-containing protein [Solitalea agri]MCO4294239.1 beta-galactosidase [Solitalea agri]